MKLFVIAAYLADGYPYWHRCQKRHKLYLFPFCHLFLSLCLSPCVLKMAAVTSGTISTFKAGKSSKEEWNQVHHSFMLRIQKVFWEAFQISSYVFMAKKTGLNGLHLLWGKLWKWAQCHTIEFVKKWRNNVEQATDSACHQGITTMGKFLFPNLEENIQYHR